MISELIALFLTNQMAGNTIDFKMKIIEYLIFNWHNKFWLCHAINKRYKISLQLYLTDTVGYPGQNILLEVFVSLHA